jgi:hypothetical protein
MCAKHTAATATPQRFNWAAERSHFRNIQAGRHAFETFHDFQKLVGFAVRS